MKKPNVYFRECGKYSLDKRRLEIFTREYSDYVDDDLLWIERCYKADYDSSIRRYIYIRSYLSSFRLTTKIPEGCCDITNSLFKYLGEI